MHRYRVFKVSSSLLRARTSICFFSTPSTVLQQAHVSWRRRDTSAFFKYTSGRWVYNEQKRLRERERVFDVSELQRLAAVAVSRKVEDILSFDKLGEGAANRAFTIEFCGGFKVVARIPYPVTQPERLIVASEAATLTFLRSKGIPVPEVYGYSATADNPAGTEYIFMEYSPGRELGTVWSDMDEHDRHNFVRSLVELESRLFSLCLPASGSLYFLRDLSANVEKLAVHLDDVDQPESLYVGPSTSLDLWYGRRGGLDARRGPYLDAEAVLSAAAEKEVHYLKRYGRPLFPFDCMRRETFNLEKQLPSVHLDSLQKYLQISKHLIPQDNPELLRPVLRHPDLRPSNIFVSDDYKITSLIDWQNSVVLPLYLHSGIPNDLDNSMDSVSRSLETPHLSEKVMGLSEEERFQQFDIFAKRQLHYFYMTETAEKNSLHFDALNYPFSIGRRRVFQLSAAPWQGDNIPLRSSLVFVNKHWGRICASSGISCPITFTAEEQQECLRLDELERDAEEQLEASKTMLGLGPDGWISHDNYEAAKAAISRMRQMCWEQAESQLEKTAVKDHWVYDDMDEDEYL